MEIPGKEAKEKRHYAFTVPGVACTVSSSAFDSARLRGVGVRGTLINVPGVGGTPGGLLGRACNRRSLLSIAILFVHCHKIAVSHCFFGLPKIMKKKKKKKINLRWMFCKYRQDDAQVQTCHFVKK